MSAEIKDYNDMIDGRNFSELRTNENFRKIAAGQGDYYTTGCLLHHPYFKEC